MGHFMTGVKKANFLLNRQLNCFMQCSTKNYQHICEPTQVSAFYELYDCSGFKHFLHRD